MKKKVYVLSEVGDKYELPVAVLETAKEVADFIGCSAGHVWNSLSWRLLETEHGVVIGHYIVELVCLS